MRRRGYLAVVAGALSSTAGCVGSAGPTNDEADDYDVGMSTNAFLPEAVETTVGTSIVWQNTSQRRHTVTAYGDSLPEDAEFFATGGYDSEAAAVDAWKSSLAGGVDPGETFSHTFEIPGTYAYYCIPHEGQGMVGTVKVREE